MTVDPSQSAAVQAAKWAMRPLETFLDDLVRYADIHKLTRIGLRQVTVIPQLADALEKFKSAIATEQESESTSARIDKDERNRLAALAQDELDLGFPVLNAHFVVGLWSMLEAMIRDYVVLWLRTCPECLHSEQFSRISIRLAEYMALSESDRYYHIVDQLDRETGGPLRQGVTRFESLLEVIGLRTGEVLETTRYGLYELSQVRNAIVHRAGVADFKLVRNCPRLDLQVGDRIRVTHGQVDRYTNAVCGYLLLIIVRAGTHFGVDMEAHRPRDPASD